MTACPNSYPLQSREDLWSTSANKLTNVIQQIIEFAKMLPGFMKLQQDDQIVLLKSGDAIAVQFWQFSDAFFFREFRAGDHPDESLL